MRRISIRKKTRTIGTNTYVLTFNKPTTPTSIRIGYINTKIETYIPNPLKCQKYEHPKDKCTRLPIYAKYENSNHTELQCENPFNCINCTGEPLCIHRNMKCGKKEKRITEIKYTRNISFPEARKIVEQTQEQPSYAYVTKKGNKEKEDKTKTRRTEQTD